MKYHKLVLIDGKRRGGWNTIKDSNDMTEEDYKDANLRFIFDNEIVLDSESHLHSIIVKAKLNNLGFKYEEYKTGSRGKHFHLFFNGLQTLTSEQRNFYRGVIIDKQKHFKRLSGMDSLQKRKEYVIKVLKTKRRLKRDRHITEQDLVNAEIDLFNATKEYESLSAMFKEFPSFGTDLAKINGLIALENRPHIKTQNIKTMLSIVKGRNKVDMDLVSKIKLKLYVPEQQSLNTSNTYPDLESIKTKYPLDKVWRHWGLSKKGNRWDSPFVTSVSKACVALYPDDHWYDFNLMQGGDVFNAVMLKYHCDFSEALKRLQKEEY